MDDYTMPTTGDAKSIEDWPWYCCFLFPALIITMWSFFDLYEGENVTDWTIALVITWSICLSLIILIGMLDAKKKDRAFSNRLRSYSDQLGSSDQLIDKQDPNTFLTLIKLMLAQDEAYQKEELVEFFKFIDKVITQNPNLAAVCETPEYKDLWRMYLTLTDPFRFL